jgi:hypothetical protein
MPKYITYVSYSSGSLARMMSRPGDRHKALQRLTEALGGSLESLPGAVSAGALNTAGAQTGAFKAVETHELMTQKQLLDVLALARDAAQVYEIPGQED